ncbi:hypothetical protein AVEN_16914-1 [Araneus ventricosus]|uniref:Uncharacterized protein n=1 Tax=Araneus ventricosus TaxID=182803 RepID=A0A4Y2JAK1_ARAVE|nr:hypothetical protein AVEN_16914-1 [Araneus ventricosus]
MRFSFMVRRFRTPTVSNTCRLVKLQEVSLPQCFEVHLLFAPFRRWKTRVVQPTRCMARTNAQTTSEQSPPRPILRVETEFERGSVENKNFNTFMTLFTIHG